MPVIDTTGSIDLPDHTLTGDLTLTGDVVTWSVSEESWFSQFRTWLKGTPPPKIVEPNLTWSLVDTGVVDTILSGLNGDELIGSGTVIDPDALAPGQIAQFTLPVLRKDKTISEELKIMS